MGEIGALTTQRDEARTSLARARALNGPLQAEVAALRERVGPEPAAAGATPGAGPLVAPTLVGLLNPDQRGRALNAWDAGSSTVSYALLERGAEPHRGAHVMLSGTVVEVRDNDDGTTSVRLATRGRYDDIIYVVSETHPSDRVVQGARVTAPAILAGTYTYEAQSGWNITLPAAAAFAVIPSDEASREMRAAR